MSTFTRMLDQGYRPVAPTREAGEIDQQIAEAMKCPSCGGPMRYQPYSKPGSYIAIAKCADCGREVQF